jgi:hypothetical protein
MHTRYLHRDRFLIQKADSYSRRGILVLLISSVVFLTFLPWFDLFHVPASSLNFLGIITFCNLSFLIQLFKNK